MKTAPELKALFGNIATGSAATCAAALLALLVMHLWIKSTK